jgi:hypothetical protein
MNTSIDILNQRLVMIQTNSSEYPVRESRFWLGMTAMDGGDRKLFGGRISPSSL